MYKRLAAYYDALLKDDEAVLWWTDFFKKHGKDGNILELASGTGEITLELAKDYQIEASDLSEAMLDEIRAKDIEKRISKIFQLDMLKLDFKEAYDNIICFCDSINYITNEEDLETLFKGVSRSLKDKGIFLFDMHSIDRLEEFKEPFIETGQLLGTDYQWSIISEGNDIFHHFAFYEKTLIQEHHHQHVFEIKTVCKLLEKHGFSFEIYTDFNQEGIHEGEKIFFVAKKNH